MDYLTRQQVKAITIVSPISVARLPEDVESATFQQMKIFIE
jgi:hypothetical protein